MMILSRITGNVSSFSSNQHVFFIANGSSVSSILGMNAIRSSMVSRRDGPEPFLADLSKRITDGSHWSPASVDDGEPMASVKDMREWDFDLSACRRISREHFDQLVKNDCKPRKGDILISKDGANLNKYAFLITEDRELVILSSIAIVRPIDLIEPEYLLAALKSPQVSGAIKRRVSGVAIPRIVLKDFRSMEVLAPTPQVQRAWVELVGPIHAQCRQLFCTTKLLADARDVLLPRLMDGRISV